jgi:hypothetical protein
LTRTDTKRRLDRIARRRRAVGERDAQIGLREIGLCELFRELREHQFDLLERCPERPARGEVDREVVPFRGPHGVGQPVGHRALRRDVLIVARAAVNDQL